MNFKRYSFLKVKVKVKVKANVNVESAMKAHKGSRSVVIFFL